MDVKRAKAYGKGATPVNTRKRKLNSEFEFDEAKDDSFDFDTEPIKEEDSSQSYWSNRYQKPLKERHTGCPNIKVPPKETDTGHKMSKIPKMNHVDDICNRASRAKLLNKDKGKIKPRKVMDLSDFDYGMPGDMMPPPAPRQDSMMGTTGGLKYPNKRPLKAESPSKHRKLESGSSVFDVIPSDVPSDVKLKEFIKQGPVGGPRKAKLNMNAVKTVNKTGKGFGSVFDLEENLAPLKDFDVVEIEQVDEPEKRITNVKDSNNCIKDGESQKFFDEFNYLFDGMKVGEPMAVRALSTFNVAKNCFNIDFRGNVRKNKLLRTIYDTLADAPDNPSLSLCTAALLYIISIDDKITDFPKSSIELLIKILESEESKLTSGNYKSTKSLDNFRKKMSELFHKELTSIEFLDLDNLTASDLVHEVLIFLTAPTAEVDFREFIRTMGGLDFFIINITSIVNKMDKTYKLNESNCMRFCKIERCLQMLENLTYMNDDNQNYVLNFKNKMIIAGLHKTLHSALLTIQHSQSNKIRLLTRSRNLEMIFDNIVASLRTMLNLTHNNEYSCTEIGKYPEMIQLVIETVLFLPTLVGEKHKLDIYTLGLGLLINLVEKVPKNRELLARCRFDSSPWLQSAEAAVFDKDKTAVELIVATFQRFHANSNELEKQTFSEAEQLCIDETEGNVAEIDLTMDHEPEEIPDEPEVEKRGGNAAAKHQPAKEGESSSQVEEDDPFGFTPTETTNGDGVVAKKKPKDTNLTKNIKVKEVVDNMLTKAGEHMEESITGSYLALLLGILAKDEDSLEIIKKEMKDPKVLIEVLRKFLQFMNMIGLTSAAVSKCAMQQIRSIVAYLTAVL